MKTVKQIIEELKQFPLDAKCYAYEGESTGIGVVKKEKYGFIHCSEGANDDPKPELFETKR